MKIKNRVYLDGEITPQQHRYIFSVLRCKNDDYIELFNEKQRAIYKVWGKELIKIQDLPLIQPSSEITLCFSPIRKLDILIEKTTEIGIKCFQPVLFHNSFVREINPVRVRKIIIEAVEQSGQCFLPQINDIVKFDDLFPLTQPLFVADISGQSKIESPCAVLIGPEGGLTEREISKCRENNARFFSLGKNILRSETAAICAVFSLNNGF
jgi:16S rRNA (uracil1498-N3)-methyltransferase